MLVFDEKKYAESIVRNHKYNTIKTQGRERCILVRYLDSIGCSDDEIKKELMNIPMSGGEYLSDKEKDVIYSKILEKAREYQFITDINVKIYQKEMDIINLVENEKARHLLFIYLVYYKWAKQIGHLSFYSKKNDVTMVIENNADVWKLAGISQLRVADRYRLCNFLFNKGLYKIDNFKSYNYIYIPFAVEQGEEVISISNFDNILGELLYYEEPNNYKRCTICDTVFKKTRSPKKYCNTCARLENIRKTKENKGSLKTQTP